MSPKFRFRAFESSETELLEPLLCVSVASFLRSRDPFSRWSIAMKRPAATPKKSPKRKPGSPAASQTKQEPVSPAAAKATATKASAMKKHPPIPKDAAKRLHSKLQTMAKSGKDGLQKAYKQCKTQEDKRTFFYNVYLLDPAVSEKAVLKKDQQETVVTDDNIDDWLTAEQVAKHKGIEPGVGSYKELVAASVKGLPERKHEDEHLAALGVKQFHYQATKTKTQTLKRKGMELLEQVGDVSQEDFADMRAAMNPFSGQRMIGNSKGSKQGGEDPGLKKAEDEVNVEVDWEQVYKGNQKKCKSFLQSMASEMHNCDTLLGKIASLASSSEMKPLLEKQVQAQKQLLEDEKKKFLTEHLGFPKACKDATEAEEKHDSLQDLASRMGSFLKGWRKELSAHKNFLDQES